jgi:hypothetical protein
MPSIAIKSINLVNNQIIVLFNQNWFQEDIKTLRQLLLSDVSNITINEVIIGADRESIRFKCFDTDFIINFDYYSQSCWFDTQNSHSTIEISTLFDLLIKKNKHYV